MGPAAEPTDLSSHHRSTLNKIFQHPASHNIDWRDVVPLLNAVGSVERHRDNKIERTRQRTRPLSPRGACLRLRGSR